MREKLTNRQEAFCREYLLDLNALQSCIRAGYSAKSAPTTSRKLMAHPGVRARIDALLAERAERVEIDADYVLGNLRKVANRCLAEETFEHAGANKALELLGKHLGLFVEKREHSFDLSSMTDDQLLAIVRGSAGT